MRVRVRRAPGAARLKARDGRGCVQEQAPAPPGEGSAPEGSATGPWPGFAALQGDGAPAEKIRDRTARLAGSAGVSFLEHHRRAYARQVQWLLVSRVAVILACLAALLLYEEGDPRQFASAYATLVAALGLAAGQLAWLRRAGDLERMVGLAVVLDLLTETAVTYFTGGIYNVGFAFLYFGTILTAVLLLSERAAFLCASAASTALALTALVYWWASNSGGLRLPLVDPALYEDAHLRWGRVTANLIGVTLAFHGVAFLGTQLPYRMSRVGILYDEVLERMREGLVAIDRRGHIVLVNAEACRLLNWGRATNLLGQPFDRVLRRREDRKVLEILARGEDVHCEVLLEIRGRAPLPVEVMTSVLVDARQGVRGVIGIFRDLTLKHRLEEMQTRLDRLTSTEEMAQGLAHELRTPLASIRGAVQELTTRELQDDADRRLSDIVRRESDRLDRLLQQFLDFARMRPLIRQRLELRRLCEETVLLLRRRPEAQAVQIECDPGAEHWVSGDPDQLRQALLNVGANALEAVNGQGSVRFSLGPEERPLLSTGPERRLDSRPGVELRIEDDGPNPIPADQRSRVFLPFFTTKKGGMGLGLAITQKILRLHEGDITCGGGARGGTCFRLWLPLAPSQGETDEELAAVRERGAPTAAA